MQAALKFLQYNILMFNHRTFIDNTFFQGTKALFTLMNMQVVYVFLLIIE